MKVRVKFSKLGSMKFIGHLDLMRYFQKSMIRAGIDIAYTEGFSPHQKMSFASPLGVGILSTGEYMDIEVNSVTTSPDMMAKLNQQMANGIEIVSVKLLSEEAKNSMSIVAAADYEITLVGEYSNTIDLTKIDEFYNSDQIIITKSTKKSEKEVDIKPMIYKLTQQNKVIYMTLATGSVMNLKPGLVMEAYLNSIQQEVPSFGLQITRKEIYANLEENNEFISLDDLGTQI